MVSTEDTAFITRLKAVLGDPPDLVIIPVEPGTMVVYLRTLVEEVGLGPYLLGFLRSAGEGPSSYFPGKLQPRPEFKEALTDLLAGRIIVYRHDGTLWSFLPPLTNRKPPGRMQNERAIRGSRLALPEALDDALGHIRQRLKDASLRVEGFTLGRRTKTEVAMLYLAGVAEGRLVEEVRRRIRRIDIDGLLEAGYLEQLITDNRRSLFPLTQATERPDKVVAAVLEGRVAILVDGSPTAILVPTTINELYQSPDDYYYGFFQGSFLRFFRVLGNVLAVALPGLYIALVGVNPELLPIKFALHISAERAGVALPLILEVFFLEIIFELFREGSLRLPSPLGPTIGITAGVVLGLAGIELQIFSIGTLFMMLLGAVASYSAPYYEVGITWRILRFVMILAAIFLGLFGLTISGLIILAYAANQNSFGVSYFAPWAPMRPSALSDTLIRRFLGWPSHLGIYHQRQKTRLRLREGERGEE